MRLLLLPLLAATAAAVELPVTGVTVLPGGLLIERGGQPAPGDEAITGLPATLDEGSLTVEIDGRAVDGWRLVRPEPLPARPADPQALQRFAAAERGVEAARRRTQFAASSTSDSKTEGKERIAATEAVALPGPEAIRAHIAFAADNAERGAKEQQSAAEALDVARRALAADPGAAPPPPSLLVPGMAGKAVRVRYLLPGANWAPTWRLEVDGGDAVLVQLATIEVLSRSALPAVPLTVATRGRADEALLADPSVPILGLGESLALERRPARTGSKGSESSVDFSLRWFARELRHGSGAVATDASLLLTVLGAGYDHKTPNKYKTLVAAGLQRLTALEPAALELPELALVTAVVGEAYAMTSDPGLRPKAEAFLACLRERWSRELPAWLLRRGGLGGPVAAAQVGMALKSCHAAGLDTGADLGSLRQLDLGRGEEAELAGLYIAVLTGTRPPLIDLEMAGRWVAAFDRWWSSGRIELVHLAILVAFQNGGEEWKLINASLRDRLVGLQQPDGTWPLEHHPLGKVYASSVAAQCLEVYYRYAPVSAGKQMAAPAATDLDQVAATIAEPVQPAWPIRQTAERPVALVPGVQVVELRRTRLAGAITWESVPVQSPGVWRRLSAVNPWPSPLPGGPVVVVADGRQLGTAQLAAAAPGAALTLDLGPDDRLRVRRTVVSATDDGMFKRTLAMTVTCRLEAPPGFAGTVRVHEPLPRPEGDQITIELSRPERLDSEAYAKRVAKDAAMAATLSAAAPEAVLAELHLVYPRSVRPRLEAR